MKAVLFLLTSVWITLQGVNALAQSAPEKLETYLQSLHQQPVDSVKILDLRNMHLNSWPEALLPFKKVVEINLDGNLFQSVPAALTAYPELHTLSMNENLLHGKAIKLRSLKKLKRFYASKNKFNQEVRLSARSNLQEVRLAQNQLAVFNYRAQGLKELELAYNKIEAVKHPFWQRHRLEVVVLYGNSMDQLPSGLVKHKNIRKLVLAINNFKEIPAEMQRFQKLESLMFYKNKLESIPDFVWEMEQLQEIDVHYNRIKSLPEGIGELTQLQELYLAHNCIPKLPTSINKLRNLEYLYAENNELQALPSGFEELVSLKRLSLLGNKFIIFPQVITQLPALEEFDISENDIESFPQTLTLKNELQLLLLHENACTEGMQCMRYLKLMERQSANPTLKFQY